MVWTHSLWVTVMSPRELPGHEGRWSVDCSSGTVAYWYYSILAQEKSLGSCDEVREQARIDSPHPALPSGPGLQSVSRIVSLLLLGPDASFSTACPSQHQSPMSLSCSKEDRELCSREPDTEGRDTVSTNIKASGPHTALLQLASDPEIAST